ncbi:AsmA-like C-terminal domain-containing protein [Dissulfurimicrobium hydrothermale]|uniref:AsmA-like C-terminal domain-containing protein n=1 Tax=Dissulfurimicrobium hydrothermale TaxID=1750598 RepID=UPI001EDACCD7|nr:AsmA-like C-terminal domain-containing protein [Dissulfurimicrobium hydrothermale]UKL13520.1 AsmA-like C-terminal domain-containing protein [Dissulfurimicrobium hydrothermale]
MDTKKIAWISLIALLIIVAILYLAPPFFMHGRDIPTLASRELANALGGRVEIGSLKLRWFPLPHIQAQRVRIESAALDLTLPQSEIYPRWELIPLGRFEFRRIYLIDPDIRIKSAGRGGEGLFLPPGMVIVKNGHLIVSPKAISWLTRPLALSGLNADLSVKSNEADVSHLEFQADFIKRAACQGKFDLRSGPFAFKLDMKGFSPHLVPLHLERLGDMRPVNAAADITLEVEGKGFGDFNARIKGDAPIYRMVVNGEDLDLSSKAFDVSFERRGDGLSVSVDRFEMASPAFSMTGYLKKRYDVGQSESVWDMAFKASNVDLVGVRKAVLALLGRYNVAKDVCDIVRGGKLSRASYAFHGKTSDLRRLDAMEITADVVKVPVHVPKVDLDLDEVSGPIKIVKGALSGEGLSARMGENYGSNGIFFLQISGEDDSFRLGLDLDADLSALPPVLNKLVDNEAFKKELSLVNGVKGRAKGHLDIKGKLHDLDVHVDVSEMNGSLRYNRLPWPITIERGGLSVGPKEVSWKGVAGAVGPHRIHAASGSVDWGKDVSLNISSLTADIDSQALYNGLSGYSVIKDAFSGVLAGIKGTIAVRSAFFSGPLLKPDRWRYKFNISSSRLGVESPLLPGPLHLTRLGLDLDERKVTISALDGTIFGQPVALTGDLAHDFLKDWRGSVEITGVANDKILAWIRAKDWIPSELFPKAPCVLKGLKVGFEPGRLTLKGRLMPGVVPGRPSTAVVMDMIYTRTEILLKRLLIKGTDGSSSEGCIISLDLDKGPDGIFSMDWQGRLSKSTLDAVLEKNTLLSGVISGSFRLGYSPRLSQPWTFVGVMDVSNFNVPISGGGILEIQGLKFRSLGTGVELDPLAIRINDEIITGTCKVVGTQRGLDINGVLKSKTVSWANIDRIIKELLKDTGPSRLAITGRIGFGIGRLQYTEAGAEGNRMPHKKGGHIYNFRSVKGEAMLLKDKAIEVSVESANLCGLNASGRWEGRMGAGLRSVFRVLTPPGGAAFQDVLPCLGYDSDIIEGPFEMNLSLEGTPERWSGGHVDLMSRDGRIRRLTLLAKVFSILNVTDIFSGALPDLFKQGFVYSNLNMDGDVKDGVLVLKKTVINGQGLNLFASGSVDLAKFDSDITFLIAPFKTLDRIIAKVPILGRVLGGKRGAVITIAVGVKGPLKDPDVTLLPARAVGRGVLDLLTNTLKIPYYLVEPALVVPSQKGR